MNNNIFDGYEEQSPEQVKNSLGIINTYINEEVWEIIKQDIEDDICWSTEFELSDLKKGTWFRGDRTNPEDPSFSYTTVYSIVSIENESIMLKLLEFKDEFEKVTIQELKQHFEIYKKHM